MYNLFDSVITVSGVGNKAENPVYAANTPLKFHFSVTGTLNKVKYPSSFVSLFKKNSFSTIEVFGIFNPFSLFSWPFVPNIHIVNC